jgi:hypothetical protein
MDANVLQRYLELKGTVQAIVTHVQGNFNNNVEDDWVPNRRPIVFAQFVQQGLWPALSAPVFGQHGGAVDETFMLSMSHSNTSGTIYYTLDGSDPRAPEGAIAGTAYGAPYALEHSAVVKARVADSGTWSPLSEAVFSCTNSYGALQVSEIMYNPAGGEEHEFIELKNCGDEPLLLADMAFSNGIDFGFARDAAVGTGEFVVLCAAPAAFAGRYPGVHVDGAYFKGLANNGERVTLCDQAGIRVLSVAYDDEWYPHTDGVGYSLVRTDFAGDPDEPSSWRPSAYMHGSPGRDDPAPPPPSIVVNEVLAHADPPLEDAVELHNLSTAAVALGGWYLSDSDALLQKYRVPDETVIGPTGFVVFYEYQFRANTNSPLAFGLSSHGEAVHVSSPEDPPLYHVSREFGAAPNGVSFGRHRLSTGADHFVPQRTLSLGSDVSASDPPARSNDFRSGTGAPNAGPRVGPVTISEFMYHPLDGGAEFVELRNSSDVAMPLYDPLWPTNAWRLEDDTAAAFHFPPGTVVPAGGYVVVVGEDEDPALFKATYGVPADVPVLGPCLRKFGNGGDAVRLLCPDSPDVDSVPYFVVDEVYYDDAAPWPVAADGYGPSLQRSGTNTYGNDPANWVAGPVGGTPGRPIPEPCVVLAALMVAGLVRRALWRVQAIACAAGQR